ncbi:MAG: carbon-nitrogen hydrolase [Planctomycetes bacterium]|nr:carbon-nitrogen hydrolase [Planctomycetota bacterium]
MNCRVLLAQIEPTLGNLSANLEMHLAAIADARARGVQMVLFPELSLSGYFLRDQVAEAALPAGHAILSQLCERSRDVSIGAGFVERGEDGRLYNSYGFFEDGRLLEVHRKVHLVTYGMFDDARDFAPGDRFRCVQSRHGRFGVLICEDMWHVSAAYLHFISNVDALLVPSASPGRGVTQTEEPGLHSVRTWNRMQEALALLFQSWIVYVNRVGSEDGMIFSGGSRVVDPFGRVAAELALLDPGVVETTLSADATRRARVMTPLRRDEKPWLVQRELTRILGQLEE